MATLRSCIDPPFAHLVVAQSRFSLEHQAWAIEDERHNDAFLSQPKLCNCHSLPIYEINFKANANRPSRLLHLSMQNNLCVLNLIFVHFLNKKIPSRGWKLFSIFLTIPPPLLQSPKASIATTNFLAAIFVSWEKFSLLSPAFQRPSSSLHQKCLKIIDNAEPTLQLITFTALLICREINDQRKVYIRLGNVFITYRFDSRL